MLPPDGMLDFSAFFDNSSVPYRDDTFF